MKNDGRKIENNEEEIKEKNYLRRRRIDDLTTINMRLDALCDIKRWRERDDERDIKRWRERERDDDKIKMLQSLLHLRRVELERDIDFIDFDEYFVFDIIAHNDLRHLRRIDDFDLRDFEERDLRDLRRLRDFFLTFDNKYNKNNRIE